MNKTKQNILFAIVFLCGITINLMRIPYSFPSGDESFFLTIVHRLALGDLPVKEIWNPVQFAAIPVLPVYSFFHAFNHNNEGIILFFRFVYVVMVGISCLFAYHKLKQFGPFVILGIGIVLLFTMIQLMAVHYNSIGLVCILGMSLLLAFPSQKKQVSAYLAGILYAIAVLCTPHLALFYFGVSLFLFITLHKEKYRYGRKCWLPFTLGSITMAIVILGFILSKISITDFICFFPRLIESDARGENALPTWLFNTLALGKAIWFHSKVTMVVVPIDVFLFLMAFFTKEKYRTILYPMSLLVSLVLCVAYWNPPYNYAMIVFVPLGLMAMLLDQEYNRNLSMIYWCGVIYALLINLSSNTILNATQHASSVCCIPTILMLAQGMKKTAKKSYLVFLCLFGMVFLGREIYDRYTISWIDEPPYLLKETIEEGIAKGIHTGLDKYNYYHSRNAIVQEYLDGEVLIFDPEVWPYLAIPDGSHYAIHSTWFDPREEAQLDRLFSYYEQVPNKTPDTILVASIYKKESAPILAYFEKHGIQLEELRNFYIYRGK